MGTWQKPEVEQRNSFKAAEVIGKLYLCEQVFLPCYPLHPMVAPVVESRTSESWPIPGRLQAGVG